MNERKLMVSVHELTLTIEVALRHWRVGMIGRGV